MKNVLSMEALKLAFDTMIVGVLALPWLMIILRVFSQDSGAASIETLIPFLSHLPQEIKGSLITIIAIAMGYLVGAAVSRVSFDFFDDELWGNMPTIHGVRDSVYCNEENVVVLPQGWRSKGTDPGKPFYCPIETKNDISAVEQIFNLQESKLLSTGVDNIDRLQQLHQQVIVLRGAALNGLLLSILCAFGLCADWRRCFEDNSWKWLTFLPMLAVFVGGVYAFWRHILGNLGHNLSEPPMVESASILLGLIGPLVVSRQEQPRFYFNGCLVGLTLYVIAFGGWWWTEVMYDQLVLHSFYMLIRGS
jgi:hypothetical protein